MSQRDSQVVDIDLTANALELLKLVGDQSANHFRFSHCDDRNEMRSRQQRAQVISVRHGALIGVRFLERLSEHAKQGLEQTDVCCGELLEKVDHGIVRDS